MPSTDSTAWKPPFKAKSGLLRLPLAAACADLQQLWEGFADAPDGLLFMCLPEGQIQNDGKLKITLMQSLVGHIQDV